MSGPLTADGAIDLLRRSPGAYTTPDQLRTLAAKVNADAPGRLTVLYSGGVSNGVSSGDVIKAMVNAGEDVRVINKSQAAIFMESRDFIGAVAEAYDIPPRPLIDGKYRGPATDWLYHPTEGPWADASARFADLTKGEVRAVVSSADAKRTFGAVELPRIIANPQVTTIEGLPRKTLARVVADIGLQPAFEMTLAKSHENVGTLRAAINASGIPIKGDAGALQLDSRAYLHGTSAHAKTPSSTAIVRSMGDFMGPPNPMALAGDAHLRTWQAQIARDAGIEVLQRGLDLGRSSPVMRGLGVLGTAGLGVDALDSGRKATHLLDQGNVTGAQSEVMHFGGRAGGGALGGAAAVAAYAAAGGAALGPGGAVVAGLAGGAVGFVVGDQIMDAMDRSRIYSQRGSDGNDWKFDPQHPAQGWSRSPRPGEPEPRGSVERASGDTSHLMHAPPRLAEELNYKANSTAVELALARGPALQDPFRQPPESTGEAVRPGVAGANQPWMRDPQSHAWTRQTLAPATPLTHGMPVQRMVTASPEQALQLDRAAQATIAANIAQGPQAIAARYQSAYDQGGWRQHGPVPEAVRKAAQTPPGQLPASDGHTYTQGKDGQWTTPGSRYGTNTAQGAVRAELEATQRQAQASQPTSMPAATRTPAQPEPIPRITTHEQRITPTPGGMSFAEAHKRRDEPEQISVGSLQSVGKLDASTLVKGSLSYRMHQANEQDVMRSLIAAQAQDRERFRHEPSPQRPSLERTQERAQEQAPRRLLEEKPVQQQAEARPAVPSAPAVQASASTQGEHGAGPAAHTFSPGHASPAPAGAPVHANPQGPALEQRANAPAPSQPVAEPAAAAVAAAQAQVAAAQAEMAAMRQQMARMEEQRRQNELERRDERGQGDQRAQREPAQFAQNHDTHEHLSAAPGLDDPRHARNPHHALFNQLKECIPDASERRLLEFTVACHANRITDEGLGRIHFDRQGGHMIFTSSWPPCAPAVVDLKNPSPEPSESIQAILQTEQQRTQMSELRMQQAAQANQQQGPALA